MSGVSLKRRRAARSRALKSSPSAAGASGWRWPEGPEGVEAHRFRSLNRRQDLSTKNTNGCPPTAHPGEGREPDHMAGAWPDLPQDLNAEIAEVSRSTQRRTLSATSAQPPRPLRSNLAFNGDLPTKLDPSPTPLSPLPHRLGQDTRDQGV